MGERKVLNKYIPSDFDPKLVPRGKKPKDDLVPVRMMLPFSIQCSTCSSFLYRGRKFNSKKEAVKGINGKYLGIQKFRFYIKCSDCSRPITFCESVIYIYICVCSVNCVCLLCTTPNPPPVYCYFIHFVHQLLILFYTHTQ